MSFTPFVASMFHYLAYSIPCVVEVDIKGYAAGLMDNPLDAIILTNGRKLSEKTLNEVKFCGLLFE